MNKKHSKKLSGLRPAIFYELICILIKGLKFITMLENSNWECLLARMTKISMYTVKITNTQMTYSVAEKELLIIIEILK